MSGIVISVNRRMLLSGVTISYTVTSTSGSLGTVNSYIDTLATSQSTGAFKTSLAALSGMPITDVSGFVGTDISPTKSPVSATTLSPTISPAKSSESGKTTEDFYRFK